MAIALSVGGLLRGFAKQPIAKAFDRRTLCGSFPAYEVVGGRERHVQLERQNKPSDRKFCTRENGKGRDYAEGIARGLEREHGLTEMRTAIGINAFDAGSVEPHIPERDAVVTSARIIVYQRMRL